MMNDEKFLALSPISIVVPITQVDSVVFSWADDAQDKPCHWVFVSQDTDGQAYIVSESQSAEPRTRAGWQAWWAIVGYMRANLPKDEMLKFTEHAKAYWEPGFKRAFAAADNHEYVTDDSGALFGPDIEERLRELKHKH